MESDCLETNGQSALNGQVERLSLNDSTAVDTAHATAAPPSQPSAVDDSPPGLVARWAVLIREYEAFQDALRVRVRQPYWPGVRPYISMLQVEASQSQRLAEGRFSDQPDKQRGELRLAMTTLAAKEGMWRIVKTCRGVMALDRRFQKPTLLPTEAVAARTAAVEAKKKRYHVVNTGSRNEGIFVNAVVDDGRTWLRVLTTTSAQLLIEMADNGWEWGVGEDDSDEDGDEGDPLEDIYDMSLVEFALDLIEAAHANRFKGAYPRIDIILTRIEETADDDEQDDKKKREAAEIARYLDKVRRGLKKKAASLPPDIDNQQMHIDVYTARDPRTLAQPPADLDVALQNLMPTLSDRLTPTLNIDTSILIALTSDITHSSVTPQDWFPAQRLEEIAREAKKPGDVLRSLMGDALHGRQLVCTQEAARAFRVMVSDMAQPSEQERARLLLGEGDKTSLSRQQLVDRYRELSSYPSAVPDDLMLPIRVETEAWDVERIRVAAGVLSSGEPASGDKVGSAALPQSPQSPQSSSVTLPAVTTQVVSDMTDSQPTLSVFFYGWAARQTTITTNLAARNKIARLLEKYRTSSFEEGPLVWVCRTARSLNGTNPRDGRKDGKTPKQKTGAETNGSQSTSPSTEFQVARQEDSQGNVGKAGPSLDPAVKIAANGCVD
ncbi:hypothetical protein Sste5346_005057 [Sporothrix stenoceras]|uniref:DUF1308 domain-containing protein n=1 Tax=Sporothrix stenoceras TaxID=5173 RepID=A0ABR3Z6Y9_9PEZI